VISPDVVARYAGDAAREVDGVTGVVEGVRKGIRVEGDAAGLELELHLSVRFGASIPDVGEAVQRQVADYLEQMTDQRPAVVNVVIDQVDGAPTR
jgi:uncharacterized alkaline shock family protein YloU